MSCHTVWALFHLLYKLPLIILHKYDFSIQISYSIFLLMLKKENKLVPVIFPKETYKESILRSFFHSHKMQNLRKKLAGCCAFACLTFQQNSPGQQKKFTLQVNSHDGWKSPHVIVSAGCHFSLNTVDWDSMEEVKVLYLV